MSLELSLVEEAIAAAQVALLSADDDAAAKVAATLQEIKAIHGSLESLVITQLARQAPVAWELQHLVAVLRILPEVDLTAALAGNIANRGALHLADELPPRVRGVVASMFMETSAMWHEVCHDYGQASPELHRNLDARDEELDKLHSALMAELASGALRPPVLVEMVLVARFLERLGDHAVEVGRWIETFTATAARTE